MKKIKQHLFLFLFANFMFFSCMNEFSVQTTSKLEESPVNESSEVIKLGSQRENPFTLLSRQVVADSEENYIYFKIRTNDFENLAKIENILGDLQTVPLDYEVLEGGCENPENPENDEYTPWFYAMRPIEIYKQVQELGEIEEIFRTYLSEEDLIAFSENDNSDSGARFFWKNYKSVQPKGKVQFWDEVLQKYVPLEGAKVTVSQWCHVKTVYTKSDGTFDIGENFTSFWQNTANIKVTFSKKNSDSVYNAFSPITSYYNAGDKSISSLSDCTINIVNNTKQVNYARILNASTVYRNLAKADNITTPSAIKFWAANYMSSAITLMQDVLGVDATSIGAVIGTVNPGVGNIIGALSGAALASYLPDIIIGVQKPSTKTLSERIIETVFHEMAHASHYTAIGVGQVSYWNLEYLKMLGGWISLIWQGESPLENCYNDGSSKQVCLIESWAYFYGYYLIDKYYNTNIRNSTKNPNAIITERNYKNLLEYTITDYTDYFYPQAFYDLIDDEQDEKLNDDGNVVENGTADKCSNYTISQIFAPYKNFSTQSISEWYKKFVELYVFSDEQEKANIKATFKHNGVDL